MSQLRQPIGAPTARRSLAVAVAGGLGFAGTEWVASQVWAHPLDPEPSLAVALASALSVAALAAGGGWLLRRDRPARGVAIGLVLPALLWMPESLRALGVGAPDLLGVLFALGLVGLCYRAPVFGLVLALFGGLARPAATAWRGPEAGTHRHLPASVMRTEPNVVSPTSSAAARPDILLLTVDTVRADAGLVDRLTGPWQRYDEAVAAAPWTLPSMLSLMTGLPVREHGGGLPLDATVGEGFTGVVSGAPWLPAQLASEGYETAGVVCNPHLRAVQGFARGFSLFLHHDDALDPHLLRHAVDELRRRRSEKRGAAPTGTLGATRDARIEAAALQLIAADSERPRFVWVHLLDPHEYRRQVARPVSGWTPGTEDAAALRAAYAANVQVAADRVERLASAASDWLVVVTSDHGEALGEGGRWGHGHTLDDVELRVPLAIRWPAGIPGGVPDGRSVEPVASIAAPVATYDIADALLGAGSGAISARARIEVGGLRSDGDHFASRYADGAYRAQVPGARGEDVPFSAELQEALQSIGYVDDGPANIPAEDRPAPR